MQHAPKAVWSIPYVSVAFFPGLKQNFIEYHSSNVSSRPDCIFEIHQLWQSGFSRVYSNSSCSCSFESEIIEICKSSHKMYSNDIQNFQECTTILNAHTKNVEKLIVCIAYILKTFWVGVFCPFFIISKRLHCYTLQLSFNRNVFRRAPLTIINSNLFSHLGCMYLNISGASLFGWLVWFYGISTIVGYLMQNTFYTYTQFYFKQFSLA